MFGRATITLGIGPHSSFNGFCVLAALLHGTLVVGVRETASFNRGHHIYSAGRPSGWALAHISSFLCGLDATSLAVLGRCHVDK